MTSYIGFPVAGESAPHLLIEVDEKAIAGQGIRKAGLAAAAGNVIAEANQQFRSAIAAVLKANVDGFTAALETLAKRPSSAEISFGLKVSGEVGNFIITKVAAEGNYSIKLTWKFEA